ncbi:hypothetical protein Trydic_g19790 [Trypoxylus dichotomus]
MAKQASGSRYNRESKYELNVTAFLASLLYKNENVENYRISSNIVDTHPFDDIVAEVQFKDSNQSQLYAIKIGSGDCNLDIIEYYDGYKKFIQEGGLKLDCSVEKKCIYFCYFCNRRLANTTFRLEVNDESIDLELRLHSRLYNIHDTILDEANCYEF